MPVVTKVMPVVLRESAKGSEVLVFRHPVAGVQLVKGTVEPGESFETAAARELLEESGVTSTAADVLGAWWNRAAEQWWVCVVMQPAVALPDAWSHLTADDGGRRFDFFWHRLGDAPSDEWHPVFRDALEHVQRVRTDPGHL